MGPVATSHKPNGHQERRRSSGRRWQGAWIRKKSFQRKPPTQKKQEAKSRTSNGIAICIFAIIAIVTTVLIITHITSITIVSTVANTSYDLNPWYPP